MQQHTIFVSSIYLDFIFDGYFLRSICMGRVGAGLRGSFLASRGIPNGIMPASVRQTAAATIVFGKTEQMFSTKWKLGRGHILNNISQVPEQN